MFYHAGQNNALFRDIVDLQLANRWIHVHWAVQFKHWRFGMEIRMWIYFCRPGKEGNTEGISEVGRAE